MCKEAGNGMTYCKEFLEGRPVLRTRRHDWREEETMQRKSLNTASTARRQMAYLKAMEDIKIASMEKSERPKEANGEVIRQKDYASRGLESGSVKSDDVIDTATPWRGLTGEIDRAGLVGAREVEPGSLVMEMRLDAKA